MDSSSSPHSRDPLFELKAQANALQIQAKAAGRALTRSAALETVARRHGYKDWNAAAAAAKADKLVPVEPPPVPFMNWRDVDSPLPHLPMRIESAGSRERATLRELVRWAKQLDYIGTHIPEDDRRDVMSMIGGRMPYVFVRDAHRFGTELFYLCERSYDEMDGVAFTKEQLELCGVAEWHDMRGGHDGYTMFSVVDDDIRMHRDSLELKQAARVVANIALLADHLNASPRQL